MKYVKRYNKFNFQTNCRICLTQSVTKMLPLGAPLKGAQNAEPLACQALELVTNEKVSVHSRHYPNSICGMCVELLKISYDLVMQYKTTLNKLKEQFKEFQQLDEVDEDVFGKEHPKNRAPVEIVIGNDRFNIKDLLIVEDEESDNEDTYEGFLRNLGKSVTASFVKKGYQKAKPQTESPSLIIEAVPQKQTSQQNDATATEFPMDTSDVEDEDIFIDKPQINNFSELELNEQDQDIIKSALNFKYKCPYCAKPMASLTRAKIHSRSCDKNETNVACHVCKNVKFPNRKQLLKHLKDMHLGQEKGGEPSTGCVDNDKLKCKICGKRFDSNGSLFYHMTKHSGKKYKCETCDKRFYTKTQARSHNQTHSREKTVVICPVCGKGFHYQSGLFYHMKIHKDERNMQCRYCPRKFYSRNSVKRHELTHTGDRPYACEYCDKKFRSLGEVKKHKLLHTGERPYHCKFCNAGFTQIHNMKMHLMTHEGDVQCRHCYKGFLNEDILRFHLKFKHQTDQNGAGQSQMQEEASGMQEILLEANALQLENEESFYIAEQYEIEHENENSKGLIVKTYELRDEILVETVESA